MADVATSEPPSPRRIEQSRALLYHVVLCLASIAMLYPLLWMLASSFKPESDIFGSASLWPRSFSLDSYWRGWSGLQVNFGRFFLNSLLVSLSCVIGNVFSCSLAAYAFARLKFRGRNFWFALMLGTLMLPYHATLIPQYILFLNFCWCSSSARSRASSTRPR
jgi:multiple sugar transport system permease protein